MQIELMKNYEYVFVSPQLNAALGKLEAFIRNFPPLHDLSDIAVNYIEMQMRSPTPESLYRPETASYDEFRYFYHDYQRHWLLVHYPEYLIREVQNQQDVFTAYRLYSQAVMKVRSYPVFSPIADHKYNGIITTFLKETGLLSFSSLVLGMSGYHIERGKWQ